MCQFSEIGVFFIRQLVNKKVCVLSAETKMIVHNKVSILSRCW